MTTAAEAIIEHLGGNERTGMCRCPLHDDRTASLHIAEGRKVPVVMKCYAGCSQEALVAWAKEQGLWASKEQRKPVMKPIDQMIQLEQEHERLQHGVKILRAAASNRRPTEYLKGRGIEIVPRNARLLSASEARRRTGRGFPAMVLPIHGRKGLHGASVTYLSRDATRKLRGKNVKKVFGPKAGGYVILGPSDPSKPLIIGEGIETTLAAMQIAGGVGIATLGTSGMITVQPPASAEIIIAADNDKPGEKAAASLAQRLASAGRFVRIAPPPDNLKDWADALERAKGNPKRLARYQRRLLRAARVEGEPRLRAVSREEFELLDIQATKHFLAPILPVAGATVIHAQKGNGKTRLGLSIAEAIATGGTLLDWHSEQAGTVLYVEGELPQRTVKLRLSRLGPTPAGRLHIISRYQAMTEGHRMGKLTGKQLRDDIDREVDEVGADVIMLDSFSSLVGENETEAESWPEIEEWIMGHRGRGRSIILVMHEGWVKGRHRGQTRIIDNFDNKLRIEKLEDLDEQDPDYKHFQIEIGLIRDETETTYRTRQIVRVPKTGVTTWEFLGVPDKDEKTPKRTRQKKLRYEQIKDLHKEGVALGEIAKRLDVTTQTVRNALAYYKDMAAKKQTIP